MKTTRLYARAWLGKVEATIGADDRKLVKLRKKVKLKLKPSQIKT